MSKKNSYSYLGSITVSPKEAPSKKVFGLGQYSNTFLNLCGLRVKCIIHRTPIINSNPSEDLWSNPVYDIFKKQSNWDKDNGFSNFEAYIDEFFEISPFIKAIYDHFSDTTIREKGICNRSYDSKQGFVERLEKAEEGFVIRYGFNRDKNGLYPFTNQFIKFLKNSGSYSKKIAKTINKDTEEELWSSVEKAEEIIPWLNILCQSFIHDRFLKQTTKKALVPAIPRENVDKGIKRLLQAKTPIITINDRRIDYFKEGDNQSLGFIPTDTERYLNVHPSRIPLVKAGGEMFGSFMSHKLLQYESKIFYERWNDPKIRLNENYSRIAIEGGYKELIHRMGSSPKGKNIEQLKKLLYFQAHFLFTIPEEGGGCRIGNLIALEERKNNFGKTEEIIITAGTMLTPEAVYKSKASKGGRLLVPFVDLPKQMVGAPATWGAQAFLQMLVLEYLTMKSREFSKNGSLHIPRKQWELLAIESQIPESFMKRLDDIQELFCCPDQGFLEKQGDEYSFNKKNEKAKQHLIDQGKMREKRSVGAQKRAKKQTN